MSPSWNNGEVVLRLKWPKVAVIVGPATLVAGRLDFAPFLIGKSNCIRKAIAFIQRKCFFLIHIG